MEIVRQVKNYSLVKNQENSKTLCYYIDNGTDVSEYQDEWDIQHLMLVKKDEFIKECKEFID
jgi:H2-forming N5,N10-methylenetetrahydromethanopterin dehydrogenase-like enzyme